MLYNYVRSSGYYLSLTITVDPSSGSLHEQGAWVDPTRANPFALVLFYCHSMYFDHIKVLERAPSSLNALVRISPELTVAAPPSFPFFHQLLVCCLLSHCYASLSSDILLWADATASIQLFGYTWPGSFPWFRLVVYQSLCWRYPDFVGVSLLFLSFDSVASGSLLVTCYSSRPVRISLPQLRMVFTIPLKFGPPDCACISLNSSWPALTRDDHVIFFLLVRFFA
jgi:hypothetical protein